MCYVTCRSWRVFIISHIRMIFGIYFTSHLACRLNRTLPLKLLHRLWALSPPQVEIIPSTDVDAILSHLYIEDSAAEPQADSTPGKPTSPEKQPPIFQPELNESPTAMVTETPTSVHPQLPDTPLESTQQLFMDTPPSTMETKRTWNLNKTISGKPPPCPSRTVSTKDKQKSPKHSNKKKHARKGR